MFVRYKQVPEYLQIGKNTVFTLSVGTEIPKYIV